MRSEPLPPPLEPDDSDSLPIRESLPRPPSAGGMFTGSAGLATGRAAGAIGAGLNAAGFGAATFGAAGLLAAGLVAADLVAPAAEPLDLADAVRLTAERFPSSFPARVAVALRRVVVRFEPEDFALVRLAVARFARVFPARLAVIRFAGEVDFLAVGRFAVERFAVERFAVERLAVDFLVEDFFLAGISPPSNGAISARTWMQADRAARSRLPACYSIGSSQKQAFAHRPGWPRTAHAIRVRGRLSGPPASSARSRRPAPVRGRR